MIELLVYAYITVLYTLISIIGILTWYELNEDW